MSQSISCLNSVRKCNKGLKFLLEHDAKLARESNVKVMDILMSEIYNIVILHTKINFYKIFYEHK